MNGSFRVGQRQSSLFHESASGVGKLSDSPFVASEDNSARIRRILIPCIGFSRTIGGFMD
jgi:hypothetical protein